MFARRDWVTVGLIALAQVGLGVCYYGTQPGVDQPKLASALLTPAQDKAVEAKLPPSRTTPAEDPAILRVQMKPPEMPEKLVPATFEKSEPLAPLPPFPEVPTFELPAAAPPPSPPAGDDPVMTELLRQKNLKAQGVGLNQPLTPVTPRPQVNTIELPAPPAVVSPPAQQPAAPAAVPPPAPVSPFNLELPPLPSPPAPPGKEMPLPPVAPPPTTSNSPAPAPAFEFASPPPAPVKDVPLPPVAPPMTQGAAVPPPASDNAFVPPPVPPPPFSGAAVPPPPAPTGKTSFAAPPPAEALPPRAAPVDPPPFVVPKAEPTPRPAVVPVPVPPTPAPTQQQSRATPPAPVAAPAAKADKSVCPWRFQLEILSGRTVLTAWSERGAEFRVRCDELNLTRPHGNIEAKGKVDLITSEHYGQCDRLAISWQEDRVEMQGNASLRSRRESELLELQGTNLRLRLSAVGADSLVGPPRP